MKSKYRIKADFFKNANTEEAAYWAGFIAADGCIVNYGKNLSLKVGISIKDLSHLRKFKIGKNITFYKNSCWIEISNLNLCLDLEKYNITPRKSLTLRFPKNINKKNIHHFMRGYFDGDGCADKHSNKKASNKLRLRLLGTKEFLEEYVDNFKFDCNRNIIKEGLSKVYGIFWSKNSHLIYKFLYKDATIYLTRKKKIMEKLMKLSKIEWK